MAFLFVYYNAFSTKKVKAVEVENLKYFRAEHLFSGSNSVATCQACLFPFSDLNTENRKWTNKLLLQRQLDRLIRPFRDKKKAK